MRIAALLLLSLTVSCSTDLTGLNGGGGRGGTPTPTGTGGGTIVTGAAGMKDSTGAGGAAGMVATGGAIEMGVAGVGGAGNQVGTGGGPGLPGMPCANSAQCATGFCFDGVCCASDCSGKCRTCATGTCTLAGEGTDPRADCPAGAPGSCGNVGACDGIGACAMEPAGTVCSAATACDSTNAAVIAGAICDGEGACVPRQAVSCNGFACSSGACGTSCADDTACAQGGFCSAQTCIVTPNLAGNGDLETGTTTGWVAANGARTPQVSSIAGMGYAHGGTYAIQSSGRQDFYQGPGYAMPTGLGEYKIGMWAMQAEDGAVALVAQIRLVCRDGDNSYVDVLSNFDMSAPQGTWIYFAGDVNMKTDAAVGPTCFADGSTGTAGEVKSATLYIDQNDPTADPPTPVLYPTLYVDDLVIQSTDGHNLIGNPNFEAGTTDGWSTTGGSSTLTVNGMFAHGGQYSLSQGGRTLPTSAVTYALPIGAARYAASFWVMQRGTMDHQLALLPLYSCIGSSTVHFATPSAPVTAPAGQWTQLTGSFVLPPADAPAGCVLSQASVALGQAETGDCGSTVECPDLFVDDASITLK